MAALRMILLALLSFSVGNGEVVTLDIDLDDSSSESVIHQSVYTIEDNAYNVTLEANVPVSMLQYESSSDAPIAIVPGNGVVVYVKKICEDEESLEAFQPTVNVEISGNYHCTDGILPKLSILVEGIPSVENRSSSISPSKYGAHWDQCKEDGQGCCQEEENIFGFIIDMLPQHGPVDTPPTFTDQIIDFLSRNVKKSIRTNHSKIRLAEKKNRSLRQRSRRLDELGNGCKVTAEVLYDACYMKMNVTAPAVKTYVHEERDMTVTGENECSTSFHCVMEFGNATAVHESSTPFIIDKLSRTDPSLCENFVY